MDRSYRQITRSVRSRDIVFTLLPLDKGLQVTIFGGERSHVGAVSIMSADGYKEIVLPGHKDQFVSGRWARELYKKTGDTVCAVCGIHYDQLAPDDIEEITKECEAVLRDICSDL